MLCRIVLSDLLFSRVHLPFVSSGLVVPYLEAVGKSKRGFKVERKVKFPALPSVVHSVTRTKGTRSFCQEYISFNNLFLSFSSIKRLIVRTFRVIHLFQQGFRLSPMPLHSRRRRIPFQGAPPVSVFVTCHPCLGHFRLELRKK